MTSGFMVDVSTKCYSGFKCFMIGCSRVDFMCFFFFKQKAAYEMRISDWSSDVCSSDLSSVAAPTIAPPTAPMAAPVTGLPLTTSPETAPAPAPYRAPSPTRRPVHAAVDKAAKAHEPTIPYRKLQTHLSAHASHKAKTPHILEARPVWTGCVITGRSGW